MFKTFPLIEIDFNICMNLVLEAIKFFYLIFFILRKFY